MGVRASGIVPRSVREARPPSDVCTAGTVAVRDAPTALNGPAGAADDVVETKAPDRPGVAPTPSGSTAAKLDVAAEAADTTLGEADGANAKSTQKFIPAPLTFGEYRS
jgi:hypothetical protein